MKTLFGTLVAGIVAAASLPHAGWLGFVYDATPYSFLAYALAITILFLFITRDDQTWYGVFGATWFWAFGYFLFGLNWVGNALLIPGNDYAWAWPLAVLGLPFILAPFLAVTMAIIHPFFKKLPPIAQMVVFTSAFTGAEGLRGHLFTGFPWNLPGMFWAENLVVFQILGLITIYGLSALTIYWALTMGLVMTRRLSLVSAPSIVLMGSFAAVVMYGIADKPKLPNTKQIQVVIAQANISQSEKWNDEKSGDHFYAHLALSAPPAMLENLPTLIIWPETTLSPRYLESPVVTEQITQLLKQYPTDSVLITGVLRTQADQNGPVFYNSVAVYDQSGHAQVVYDKHHLVPFGEYIPYQRYIPLEPVARFNGMQAGSGPETVALPRLPRFSPLICYEVIFSGQVVAPQKMRPELLINFTNDGWYGDSPGPYQHLMEARARAIETNTPLIRAAGTGISAVFAQNGHIIQSLKYNHSGSLVAKLAFW